MSACEVAEFSSSTRCQDLRWEIWCPMSRPTRLWDTLRFGITAKTGGLLSSLTLVSSGCSSYILVVLNVLRITGWLINISSLFACRAVVALGLSSVEFLTRMFTFMVG